MNDVVSACIISTCVYILLQILVMLPMTSLEFSLVDLTLTKIINRHQSVSEDGLETLILTQLPLISTVTQRR